MLEDFRIASENAALRPTTEGDLDFVIATERSAENPSYVNIWSRDEHLAIIADADKSHFIVETDGDGRPVGYLILTRWPGAGHAIELTRITIAEPGRGFGRAALRLVKRLAFEHVGVHRLSLDTRDHNERALRLYESEGFVREGVLRDFNKVDGRFESLIVMSILEGEYQ